MGMGRTAVLQPIAMRGGRIIVLWCYGAVRLLVLCWLLLLLLLLRGLLLLLLELQLPLPRGQLLRTGTRGLVSHVLGDGTDLVHVWPVAWLDAEHAIRQIAERGRVHIRDGWVGA